MFPNNTLSVRPYGWAITSLSWMGKHDMIAGISVDRVIQTAQVNEEDFTYYVLGSYMLVVGDGILFVHPHLDRSFPPAPNSASIAVGFR